MKKLSGLCLILFILTAFFTGCDKKDNGQDDKKAYYNIYYLNTKASGIASESYAPVKATREELVEELLNALRKEPENVVYKKALPDTVTIREYNFNEDGSLTINFEANYNELKGIPEVLCRAAIVKTLSQIPDVDYIKFNVNSQPLIDSNGTQIGLMTDEDFIESTGAATSYKVILYFAAEGGKTLVASDKVIYYTGNGSIEETIINQLINGPTELGMHKTIPEGTTLLNVNSREGICYVDFNEKFRNVIPDISAEATIYSIVNSLVELPGINKVQFQINGALVETFHDLKDFNGFFERNLDIINVSSK